MDMWCVRRPVRDLRPGDHAWLAYAADEERRHVVGAFIQDGLAAGDKVICLCDDPAELATGLPGTPPGAAPAVIPSSACSTDGRFDPDRTATAVRHEIERAERAGHRSVRLTSELTWAVDAPDDPQRLVTCERRFDSMIGPSVTVTAICQIDRRRCGDKALASLSALHPVLVEPNPEFEDMVLRITRTFQPPGLSLCGELDASRHAVFAEALATAIEAGNGDGVHLDLADLEFMDLGALNLMTYLTRGRPGHGPIVLDNLPHQLRAVVETLGWRHLPGLRPGERATR